MCFYYTEYVKDSSHYNVRDKARLAFIKRGQNAEFRSEEGSQMTVVGRWLSSGVAEKFCHVRNFGREGREENADGRTMNGGNPASTP